MRAMLFTLLTAVAAPQLGERASGAPQCVTIAGPQVGALPLVVSVGATAVTFSEWTAKDADATELVGFRTQTDGQVRFEVTAGDETWVGTGDSWLNPHGVVGPRSAPISSVRFCID